MASSIQVTIYEDRRSSTILIWESYFTVQNQLWSTSKDEYPFTHSNNVCYKDVVINSMNMLKNHFHTDIAKLNNLFFYYVLNLQKILTKKKQW